MVILSALNQNYVFSFEMQCSILQKCMFSKYRITEITELSPTWFLKTLTCRTAKCLLLIVRFLCDTCWSTLLITVRASGIYGAVPVSWSTKCRCIPTLYIYSYSATWPFVTYGITYCRCYAFFSHFKSHSDYSSNACLVHLKWQTNLKLTTNIQETVEDFNKNWEFVPCWNDTSIYF